ncbi:MAG: class I SAM-dependent methyltransferase [Chitinophagales bacterium]
MFPSFYSRKYKKKFEVKTNALVCEDITVPVVDGISRFVHTGSYASLFGEQWKKYKKTQLDSYTGIPISATRLFRCLGPLKDNLRGKLVLEAGCGAGRFTEVLLQQGARLVSADLSSAVEANKENFALSDTHQIIQADINDMPFENGTFDVVICIGVIQHTPSPEETIANLYNLVKPGGYLVIDHYTQDPGQFFMRTTSWHRRRLRKKPFHETLAATTKLVKRYLPWHRRFANNRVMRILLNRISPIDTYYQAYPQLNDQLQYEWSLLDTHDSLTDWYKHLRNKKQIASVLSNLGATEIWCEYGGNGVEARCQKPF